MIKVVTGLQLLKFAAVVNITLTDRKAGDKMLLPEDW
jgi:hypothetical protein